MVQPYDQIKQAERTAESETRNQLVGKPLQEILKNARAFSSEYKGLIQKGFEQQGWISYTWLNEMLDHAYPDADDEERKQVATAIEQLILDRLGEPTTTVQQSDIIAAESRRETALKMIAEHLTESQISDLEAQARANIPDAEFPENFEDHKAEWLAEWAARRLISLRDPIGPMAA